MKLKTYLAQTGDATEGERALMRIADALEAGKMPDHADAEMLIDAAALIGAMIRDKEPIENRREALTRKLKMTKPGHRPPAAPLTAGEVMAGEYGPRHRAKAFWLARANGAGYNEAIRQAMEVMNCCSRSSIQRAIKEHPEAREAVLMTYQEMADDHRAEHGEDHAGLLAAIDALGS